MAKIKSTNGTYPEPTPTTRWVGIIFFIVIHGVTIFGAPYYLFRYGMNMAEIILFVSYMTLTGFSITVGYHRLFSHLSFKAHPVIQFILLFFGAATFEQSALKWASQHRQHHIYTDTEKDPYSIQKGFWYAHMGWILFWKHKVNYDNVKDLMKNKLVMDQHHGYTLWSLFSGMILPVMIGFLIGKPLGAFIMTVCFRLVVVMNSAFFINSYCHTFGTKPHDKTISARNHWLGAFLTNGEGYHNFHHKFPADYRNGIMWYHWDPTKWTIFVLSKLGLASDLKRTPEPLIQKSLA